MAVQDHSLADDTGIGGEAPLKQGVAQDDDVFVCIGEEASGGGLYRRYGPEIAGDLCHHRLIGGIAVGDGLVAISVSAHFVEGLRLSAPVEKV